MAEINWDFERWKPVEVEVRQGKGGRGSKGAEPVNKQAEIVALAGVEKVPGSLNLRSAQHVWLRHRAGVRWTYGLLYPARMGGINVVFTKASKWGGAPRMFHVYADQHLRSALSLTDGDLVTLEVPVETLSRAPWLQEAVHRLRLLRARAKGPSLRMSR